MNSRSRWRSATSVRTALLAALASTVFVGAYTLVSQDADPQAGPAQSHGGSTDAVSFTTADAGSCLNWSTAADGTPTGFEQTDCDQEHRFEVSAREDLGTYPSSEFGDEAERPDVTRQAQLREELCRAVTLRYLDGRLDPSGRYSVASILPPAADWEAGDRTLLCGLQSTDDSGTPVATHGNVAKVDQARVTQPGECVAVDEVNALHKVDCGADHQLETTLIVDLAPVFPQGTPSVEEQDEHLKEVCTQAAMDYLGGEEQLYRSTLQPFWSSLSAESWDGGSRSVNCALVSAGERGFNTLAGSAKGEFTVNGEVPPPPPERRPLRSESESASASATPTASPAASESAPAPAP